MNQATPDAALPAVRRIPEGADTELVEVAKRFGVLPDRFWFQDVAVALAREEVRHPGGDESVTYVGKADAVGPAFDGAVGEWVEFRSWLFDPEADARRLVVEAAPDALHAGEAGPWVAVTSLVDGRTALAPAHRVFGRFAERTGSPARPGCDSTGTAAGRSPEAARLAALLEAIERDATAIWWTCGAARPAVRPPADLAAAIAGHGRALDRHVALLDLTTDLAVPVVACVTTDPDGALPALGVAAALDRDEACRSAFREAMVSELALAALHRRIEETGEPTGADRDLADWYDRVDRASAPWIAPAAPAPIGPPPASAVASLDDLVARLRAAGHEPFCFDLTRAAYGVPVARVLVPGLARPDEPPTAARRAAVEAAGWRSWRPAGPEPEAGPSLAPVAPAVPLLI